MDNSHMENVNTQTFIFITKVSITCFIFTTISIGSLLLPSFNSMGPYDQVCCALCVGLQPIAFISTLIFRKKDHAIALGLSAGLLLVNVTIPLLFTIWAIYVCQTGSCPPGLSGG